MKVRLRHMANSSSNSFVLVVPKSLHITAIEELSPNEIDIIKNKVCPKGQRLGNTDCVVIAGYDSEDYCRVGDYCLEPDDWGEFNDEFFSNYLDKLRKFDPCGFVYEERAV